MADLIIAHRLKPAIVKDFSSYRLVASRKLDNKEVAMARRVGLRRFYFPFLDEPDAKQFFCEFDRFWNDLIEPYDPEHPFWRNGVSSKMQEWESSVGYLALKLFTLTRLSENKAVIKIIVVCANLEEEEIWIKWARKYKWNFIDTRPKPFLLLLRRFLQEILNILQFLRWVILVIGQKIISRKIPEAQMTQSGRSPFLIVSMFYRQSFQNGRYTDPFFGRLHESLKSNHKTCVYVCEPLEYPVLTDKKPITDFRETVVCIPYALLSWKIIIRGLFRLFLRKIETNRCDFMGSDFSSLVKWQFRSFAFSYNVGAEIFFMAIEILCRRFNFERLLCIFEGNVFERACLQAFSKAGNDSTVGYSHAVIYPLNLKLHATEKELRRRPEFARYVCPGRLAKDLLNKVGNRPISKLEEGCALRHIPFLEKSSWNCQSGKHILVALDGVWSCVYFLDWLLEHKDVFKEYKVCVRSHPNIPIKNILRQCLNSLPENFKVSDADLALDLQNSFCVVYRQSSLGVQALLNGIPVIHLAIDAPLTSDPIESLNMGKWTVGNAEALKDAIQEIRDLGAQNYRNIMESAKVYLEEYFADPTPERMRPFIEVSVREHVEA